MTATAPEIIAKVVADPARRKEAIRQARRFAQGFVALDALLFEIEAFADLADAAADCERRAQHAQAQQAEAEQLTRVVEERLCALTRSEEEMVESIAPLKDEVLGLENKVATLRAEIRRIVGVA